MVWCTQCWHDRQWHKAWRKYGASVWELKNASMPKWGQRDVSENGLPTETEVTNKSFDLYNSVFELKKRKQKSRY